MGMHRNRTSSLATLIVLGFMAVSALAATVAFAQSAVVAAPAAAPDLAARVADLEAYVTNGTPKYLSSPGPGHNAWMMTSSALVQIGRAHV